MLRFFILAIVLVVVLTGVVRFAQLRVRRELPDRIALLLTAAFIVLLLSVWWLLTDRKSVV